MPFEDPRPDGLERVMWACAGAAVLLGVLILVGCALAIHAYARPPDNPDPKLHSWFETQHSKRGVWCCNVADGHILDDSDWKHDPEASSGYGVRIVGRWFPVPDHALRDPAGGPNPTGSAIVWYSIDDEGGGPLIFCFAPGFEY